MSGAGRNALAGSRSPFLQHGAGQPVSWLPWGEEAFARARAEGRPILLDIGAVWCHWCHVMDSESYEDEETAELINALYIPVKVDRDERPDVDARYQRAVQVLTGQGGWPLTAFLTPDGEVYHGGTYFPPDDRHGRPSFRRVLREVARVWSEERPRALDAAKGIGERLATYVQAEVEPGEPTPRMVADTLEELAESFDFRHGGFGRAPKFPNAGAIDLLFDHYLDVGSEWARRVVTETLHAMATGGIHDQLGGGFHRYATDARWIIPHFEKMAYDNGVLLATFARVASRVEDPLYAEVVDGIVAHYTDITPALVADGGFPASQDADFGFDNDGDYWTWTHAELEHALGQGDALRAVRLRFGLDDPAGSMHLDVSRHVLFRALSIDVVAGRMETDAARVSRLLDGACRTLKAARDERPRPFVDETLYTGWVALVASGHIAAARHLDRREAGEAGLRALERLYTHGFDDARGLVHRLHDPASGEYLDDHAHAAVAFLDAFELTQQQIWLDRARATADVIERRFLDPDSGAFLDRPRDAGSIVGTLDSAYRPITDAPSPSGNGHAALALFRLAALTGEEHYHRLADGVTRAFATSAQRLASSAATYIRAVSWATGPVTTILIVGSATSAADLLSASLATYRPRTVVRRIDPDDADRTTMPDELRGMITAATPRAYVCAGTVCVPPADTAEALARTLRDFRG